MKKTDETQSTIFPSFTGEEELLRKAKLGQYIIFPLQSEAENLAEFSQQSVANTIISAGWEIYNWNFSDLYDSINHLLLSDEDLKNRTIVSALGVHFNMDINTVLVSKLGLPADSGNDFCVINADKNDTFSLSCVQLLVMHTGIGFLILGIEASSPRIYDQILHPGTNVNDTVLTLANRSAWKISLLDLISKILENTGMTDYEGCLKVGDQNKLARDASVYSIAILPGYLSGDTSNEIKRKINFLCQNIHQSCELGSPILEEEIDDPYRGESYAILDHEQGREVIRWGLYALHKNTMQIIQDPSMTIHPINIFDENREDNYLPFILLALYERYSCFVLAKLFRNLTLGAAKEADWLEMQMLKIKAFGIIMPEDMTPFDNANIFMSIQRKIYDIPEIIELINNKISMLSHIRKEKEQENTNKLENMLTVFGVLTITCSCSELITDLFPNATGVAIPRVCFAIVLLIVMIIYIVPWLRKKLYKKGRKS